MPASSSRKPAKTKRAPKAGKVSPPKRKTPSSAATSKAKVSSEGEGAKKPVRKAKTKTTPAASKPKPKPKLVQIQTRETDSSVNGFIATVDDPVKRADCERLVAMMSKLTGEAPKMWGSSLIGFGRTRLTSPATGRQVDWFCIGFSPRKANLSLYITGNLALHKDALAKLGPHKTGAGCLYVKRLSDVDLNVLEGMMKASLKMGYYGAT